MPKKIAQNPAIDPTLPKAELVLDGKTYNLCYDFGSLALAEAKLRELKQPANLLHALNFGSMDATMVTPMLFAAMLKAHPETEYEEVVALMHVRNVGKILDALAEAYIESIAEPSKEPKANPQPPASK